MRKFIEFIFFGNFFYGICIVAMTIDASLFQGFLIDFPAYYLCIACLTIVYYTQSYEIIFKLPAKTKAIALNKNKRFQWFQINGIAIFFIQILLFLIGCISLYKLLFIDAPHSMSNIRLSHILIASLFVLSAFLYYSTIFLPKLHFSLRAGLIKPFIIGFVWAGIVTVIPAIAEEVITNNAILSGKTLYIFIDYFLFISILAIIFDIKDYEDDNNLDLKTFVVTFGKAKTINYIIIPLCILYAIICTTIVVTLRLNIAYLIYFLLIATTLLLISRGMFIEKDILFYLIVIDGLMLIKALAGITVGLIF